VILVGLAGEIGVGKTTVAARLAEHGAAVIDADRIAHGVLETDAVQAAIMARFGADIVAADGRVRRPALASLVFGPAPGHTAALEALEAIVHPVVRSRIESELTRLRVAAGDAGDKLVVVLDVPLLVQSGWAERCDRVIEVVCDNETRQKRLQARGWSAEAIAWRDAAWRRRMPSGGLQSVIDAERIATVDTSSAMSYTQGYVDRVWQWICGGSPPR
jgi:dephospho-CoA kinase